MKRRRNLTSRTGASRNYLPEYEVVVREPKFEVSKKLINNRREAYLILTYMTINREHGDEKRSHEIQVQLPVISLWSDNTRNEAVKAHLGLGHTKRDDGLLQRLMFYRALEKAKEAVANRHNMVMTASSQMVIRYGMPNETNYSNTTDMDGGYQTLYYYNSKSEAIKGILDALQEHRNIGGINIASFATVPNELLVQMGFTMVPDIIGQGLPMWMGNPKLFHDLQQNLYRSEDQRKFRESLAVFLETLRASLQAA